MKILSICHHYDSTTPGGIINKKVLDSLCTNNDVKIITAFTKNANPHNIELFVCSPVPYRPHRFFEKIGNYLVKNIDDIFWEIRAKIKIKEIFKEWKPDVIYARGVPLSPLNVGYRISKEFNIPLMIHFSDPIPAPIEWKPDKDYRLKMLNGIRPILYHADKISFVTKEMIDYEEKASDVIIKDKSVVLFNPLSKIDNFCAPSTKKFIFLYIGSFYGNRNPDTLIDGFSEFSANHKNCELHIVGRNNHLVHYHGEHIKILPFSTNPFKLMKNANIMVDVDSNSEKEVFMSSKLLDYLSVNRIILSITPTISPARELLSNLKNTVIITSHNKKKIINALEKALSVNWSKEIFDERKEIQSNLSLSNIVKKTEQELFSILN